MVGKKELDQQQSQAKIKHRKVMRKSTLVILSGVFILSFLTVLVVKQSPSIKDRYIAPPPTAESLLQNLVAFKVSNTGEFLPFSNLVAADELVLKVSVLRPTFVGLLISVNQQKPTFAFYTRLPPGESRLIERQGERFSYKVSDTVKNIKFCAVYASDKSELQKMNDHLRLIWVKLPETACLTLK